MGYGVVASQLQSAYDAATGKAELAFRRQQQFMRGAAAVLPVLPESMPIVGQIIAAGHCCRGDRRRGSAALTRSSRYCAVVGVGVALGAVGVGAHAVVPTAGVVM